MATQTSPNINAERIKGHLQLSASTTASSQLNLIQGTAPVSPVAGDIYRTSSHIVIYNHLAIENSGTGALRIGNVGNTNARDLSIYRNANSVVGFAIENNTAGSGNYVNINFGNSSTNGFGNANISRYDYANSGTYTGTSVVIGDSFVVGNFVGNGGALGSSNIVFKDSAIIGLTGGTATNYGFRADAAGFRIGQLSTLHTSNSYVFSIEGGLTYRTNYSYGRSGIVTDAQTVIDFNFYDGYIRGGTGGNGNIYLHPGGGGVYIDTYLVPTYLSMAAGSSIQFKEFNGGYDHGSIGYTAVPANSQLYWKGKLRAESELRVTAQAGTGDRLVQADANGIQTASTEIVAQYVTDSTVRTQLETPGNWDINFDFIGSPGITGTYQGQMHYDNNYLYMCVADDVWIRLTRG